MRTPSIDKVLSTSVLKPEIRYLTIYCGPDISLSTKLQREALKQTSNYTLSLDVFVVEKKQKSQ
jgi:hypothetical protein